MEKKTCSKCNSEIEIENFSKDGKSKDGLQSWCKPCKLKSLKIYFKKNPHKKRKVSKEDSLKRYNNNKLNYNISRRIRRYFKSNNEQWSLDHILGYSLQEFKKHIELLFKEGMSWSNHGLFWEIDHKLPISSFNITDYKCPDFKKCWSLNNIQPLEKSLNAEKGKKINYVLSR